MSASPLVLASVEAESKLVLESGGAEWELAFVSRSASVLVSAFLPAA
jgi:hypothetical protein